MVQRRFMANRVSMLLNAQKNRVGMPKSSLLAVSAEIHRADAAIKAMFENVKALTL
jgi:hypothetical protein